MRGSSSGRAWLEPRPGSANLTPLLTQTKNILLDLKNDFHGVKERYKSFKHASNRYSRIAEGIEADEVSNKIRREAYASSEAARLERMGKQSADELVYRFRAELGDTQGLIRAHIADELYCAKTPVIPEEVPPPPEVRFITYDEDLESKKRQRYKASGKDRCEATSPTGLV